ncbi:hypothetical protein B0H17DRAFT_1335960 [Mycena rosella]|uniref:Uncharacterized protein n=1 Tax=Mycena rosella TaxID=1033263 RepID=A0AAD7CXC1_MYCRO|nr:hypothetical protein B0H17DRAFT_1335960 [Mycena rosella]
MSTTMTATSKSTARAPSYSTAASTSTLNSSTTTATPSLATTVTTTRVRFDAECVLIPDVPFASSKRPRMLTKSYSLPLWRKQRPQREEEQEHVVLKVALPRCVGTPFPFLRCTLLHALHLPGSRDSTQLRFIHFVSLALLRGVYFHPFIPPIPSLPSSSPLPHPHTIPVCAAPSSRESGAMPIPRIR